MSRFRTRIKVRFSDVDRAGIAYYPRVVDYFHRAMEDFFEECVGAPYARVIEDDGLGFPTVALDTQFLSPLRFGEVVEVEVGIAKLGNTSVVFHYQIVGADGTVKAKARVTTVCVELEGLKPVPVPERYRATLLKYLESTCK